MASKCSGTNDGQPGKTAHIDFGLYVNNRAAVFLEHEYPLARVLEAASLAEDMGFEFVSVGDSILAKPRYSPIPVLSAIATRTARIKLATGILQPHLRNPVILAQEWTTLDVLSGGRTILGVGLGGGTRDMLTPEGELFGIPAGQRGRAFEEAVELLRHLWTEERVTYCGSFFRCREVSIGYRPIQRPHPPIIVACGHYGSVGSGVGLHGAASRTSDRRFHGPFERVACLGNGWMTNMATPAEFSSALESIRTVAADRFGRTLGPEFRTVLNCFINVGTSVAGARREARQFLEAYHGVAFDDETLERWTIYGPPERCAERIMDYAKAGVGSFQFVVAARDQLGQIRTLAEGVRLCLNRAAPEPASS